LDEEWDPIELLREVEMNTLAEVKKRLVAGEMESLTSIVRELLDAKVDPREILENALILGMNEVGDKMGKREIFIPEVLLAARAMGAALSIIRPALLQQSDFKGKGTIVLGTVRGDIHDIGKALVRYMLEGGGFTVIDLGVDVTPEAFVQAIHEHNPAIVGMSAMLTTTMREMENTIKLFEQKGCRDKVKVMVGGAPLNRPYAEKIGADGYAEDASTVIREASRLL
jgi:5-methyltetrahydrofolate--homocysteine methyltransferase